MGGHETIAKNEEFRTRGVFSVFRYILKVVDKTLIYIEKLFRYTAQKKLKNSRNLSSYGRLTIVI